MRSCTLSDTSGIPQKHEEEEESINHCILIMFIVFYNDIKMFIGIKKNISFSNAKMIPLNITINSQWLE